MSPAVMTFHRPLHRQTVGAGGRGGDRERARTACSVDVSSIKASPYWPYIGAAVRVLGTPCCDCITTPDHTPLPHARAAPSHPPNVLATSPLSHRSLLKRHQQHRPP